MIETTIKIAADGLLIVIVLIGGVALLKGIPKKHVISRYSYAVMAGMTALLVGKLMSLLYQPTVARPFLELGVPPGALFIDNPGFPSDHALLAGVIVLAVTALTPYKKTALILAGLAVIMAIARVMALVHTPLDVTAGFMAACLGGLWYIIRRNILSR